MPPLNKLRTCASVLSVKLIAPVELLYDKSPPALIESLALATVKYFPSPSVISVVLNTPISTAMLLGFALIPCPAPTSRVNAPALPPPVKPFPAVTDIISAALSFAIVTTFPVLVTVILVPPCITTSSPLVTVWLPFCVDNCQLA